MSFYRTYRPQVIAEIDNIKVREQLLSLLSKDRLALPHAYFFTGPKGTGKTTAARVIAKLFNCEKPKKTGPCGSCDQCVSIAKGTSLDVIEMDAASNRGIDEIRALRDRIGLVPVSAPFTIYIIDEVHMLTTEAFNALLKTLEEPPMHAVFVLATTDAHKVPQTILSRCLLLQFNKASQEELLHALARIVEVEKISITDAAIARIAEVSDGAFRDAVKFLEQVSFKKGKINLEDIDTALTISTRENVSSFVVFLCAKQMAPALAHIQSMVEGGVDMKSFLTDVLSVLQKNLVEQITNKEKPLADTDTVKIVIALLIRAYGEMRYSPIPELPIELAIIDLCPETVIRNTKYESPEVKQSDTPLAPSLGLLTMEKLVEHWPDFILATKPHNHSVAGVLRSSRPKSVAGGIVTIEAFYKFHQEKLADVHTRHVLSDVLKKLFGEKVIIEIVLGKK